MAYHLGRIVAERFDHECRVVALNGERPDHGRWDYPDAFPEVSLQEMELEISEADLLIANPSFWSHQFGLRLPGRKLMYVQGFGRLLELDGSSTATCVRRVSCATSCGPCLRSRRP